MRIHMPVNKHSSQSARACFLSCEQRPCWEPELPNLPICSRIGIFSAYHLRNCNTDLFRSSRPVTWKRAGGGGGGGGGGSPESHRVTNNPKNCSRKKPFKTPPREGQEGRTGTARTLSTCPPVLAAAPSTGPVHTGLIINTRYAAINDQRDTFGTWCYSVITRSANTQKVHSDL